MSSDKEKLEDLSQRIRHAEAETKPAPEAESNPLRNAGYDFAGTLIGSVILGVVLDRVFGTAPWCVIGCLVLGFIAGIMGVWNSMQRSQNKSSGKD